MDTAVVSLAIKTDQLERGVRQTEKSLDGLSRKLNDTEKRADQTKRAFDGFGRSTGLDRFFQGFGDSLTGARRDLTSTATAVKGFAGNLGELPGPLGSLGSSLDGLVGKAGAIGSSFGIAAGGVGLLAAGAGIAAASILNAAVAGAKFADGLSDLAGQLGVSVSFLERLDTAYTLAGGSAEQARGAINKFRTSVGEAASGEVPKLEKALRALGIEPAEASKNFEAALRKTLDTLSLASDRTAAAALGVKLFGSEGLRLIAVNRDLADSGSELNRTLQRFGLLAGGEAIGSASKFGDQLDVLDKKFQTMQVVIGGRLAPTLVKLSDTFLESFTRVEPTIIRTAELLGDVIDKASRGLALIAGLPSAFPDFQPRPVRGPRLNETDEQKSLRERAEASLRKQGIDVQFDPTKLPPEFRKNLETSLQREAANDPTTRGIKSALEALLGKEPRVGGAARSIPDIPGLSRHFNFLPDVLKEIDERALTTGKSFLDLSKGLVGSENALGPLGQKLAILRPAAANAKEEFEALRKSLSGRRLTDGERDQLEAARQKAEQLTGASRQTQEQFDNLTIRVNTLKQAMGGLPPIFRELEDSLKLIVRPTPQSGASVTGPDGTIRDSRIPGGILGQVGGRLPGAPASPGPDPAPPQARNEYIKRFEQDARRTFDDLFTGILTGAAGVRDVFGNFFLSLGEGIARRFSESITDKLFDSFFGNLEKGFNRLTNYLGGLFNDLLSSILKPIGKSIGGFFGNIFGAAFGGGFADGGFIRPGQFGIVGERGPEFAFGGASGMTIMNRQQMAAAGGSYGAPTVIVNISTPDAQSFQSARSRAQVERSIAASVARGMRQMSS